MLWKSTLQGTAQNQRTTFAVQNVAVKTTATEAALLQSKAAFSTGCTGFTAAPTYCKLHHCRPITDPHWSHVPSPRTFVQHLVSRMGSADSLGKFSPDWSPRREAASPSASPRPGGRSQRLQQGCSTTRFIGLCCSHGARRINARP